MSLALALVLVTYTWQLCARQALIRTTRRRDIRVFNGVDVKRGNYRYVVALLHLEQRMCTGTLIASTWVLSAAHCTLDSVQYGNLTVWPTKVTAISKLLKRIIHPSYSTRKYEDLAMLLVEEVPINKFASLAAIDYRTIYGLRAKWVGGGLTSWSWDATNVIGDYMRPLQLGTGVVTTCQNYELPWRTGAHLCVAGSCAAAQHVMPADSGAPLFVEGRVVGVAFALHDSHKISIFTAVSPHLTWIFGVMGNHNKSSYTSGN